MHTVKSLLVLQSQTLSSDLEYLNVKQALTAMIKFFESLMPISTYIKIHLGLLFKTNNVAS